MRLFLLKYRGLWGDTKSHPLPAVVSVHPYAEMGVVEIDGKKVGISGGKFTIENLADGLHTLKVNGVICESFFCHTSGGVKRISPASEDLRAILPYIVRMTELENKIAAIETQLTQKDIFG